VHPIILARMRVRERQILVDRDPSVTSKHISDLNEWELVVKVNEALTKMITQQDQGPKEAKAVGAKKL